MKRKIFVGYNPYSGDFDVYDDKMIWISQHINAGSLIDEYPDCDYYSCDDEDVKYSEDYLRYLSKRLIGN